MPRCSSTTPPPRHGPAQPYAGTETRKKRKKKKFARPLQAFHIFNDFTSLNKSPPVLGIPMHYTCTVEQIPQDLAPASWGGISLFMYVPARALFFFFFSFFFFFGGGFSFRAPGNAYTIQLGCFVHANQSPPACRTHTRFLGAYYN